MLSEALRLIRVFHDLKQIELASELQLSRSYVSELEKGKKNPTMEVIEKYATYFQIPASSIMFFAENLPKENNKKTAPLDKSRVAIASKVLDFLKLVEARTT